MDKVVIYARVSSKEQEETGYSLPAQEKFLKDYAEKKNLHAVRVFSVSESASGKKLREVFSQMMEYTKKGGVKIIICEKADRLTRNFKDAVMIDEWLNEDEGRQIHLVKDSLVLHKNSRSQEKLNWGVRIIFSKNYIDNLSEEVKKGQAEKIRQGWLPSRSPLGYKTIGDKGRKTHVLDEQKAPYIRRAFEQYATGNVSLAALRDQLYTEGFRTHGGARLSKSRLADILSDPFYYGVLRWNDVVHRGLHEPLVSQELWERVQLTLQGKTAPHHNRHMFKFTKLMKCGECGGTISGEIQKGHVYYSCKHGKTCAQRGATREEEVENKLMGVFKLFETITPAEAEKIYTQIRSNHQAEIEYKENALRALQARYNTLQRSLDILYDDRLGEKISQERWETKQALINDEQATVQREIEKIKTQETKYFELYINILDLARRAREIYEKRTPEQRRTLLQLIFSNLTLKDKNTSYALKEPLETLSKRVQERLDAQKNFEPRKGLRTKPILTTGSKNDSLLEWRDAFRTFDWISIYPNPQFHIETMGRLMTLAR